MTQHRAYPLGAIPFRTAFARSGLSLRLFLTTLLFTAAASSGAARAAEVRAGSETIVAATPTVAGGETALPVYELLTLDAYALSLPGFDDARFVLRGWGRLALADDSDKATGADLNLAYLEGRRGPLSLRMGRQLVAQGLGRMTMLDGVNLSAALPMGLSVQAFGGHPTKPQFTTSSDNWLIGARLGKRFAGPGAVGLSYRREMGVRGLRFHQLGADAFALLGATRWLAWAAVDATVLRLSEARLSVDWTIRDDLNLSIDAERVHPNAVLPATSLFTVFSDAPHDSLGAAAQWQPSPYYDVSAKAEFLLLADGGLGHRIRLQALAFREKARQSLIGAELRRTRDDANGHSTARLFTALQLQPNLRVAGDVFAHLFDKAVNDTTMSLLGQLHVAYTLTPTMRWVITGGAGSDARNHFRAEAMMRFVYGFNTDLTREVLP